MTLLHIIFLLHVPHEPVCGVINFLPNNSLDALINSSMLLSIFTPPALPLPPACIWALSTYLSVFRLLCFFYKIINCKSKYTIWNFYTKFLQNLLCLMLMNIHYLDKSGSIAEAASHNFCTALMEFVNSFFSFSLRFISSIFSTPLLTNYNRHSSVKITNSIFSCKICRTW